MILSSSLVYILLNLHTFCCLFNTETLTVSNVFTRGGRIDSIDTSVRIDIVDTWSKILILVNLDIRSFLFCFCFRTVICPVGICLALLLLLVGTAD